MAATARWAPTDVRLLALLVLAASLVVADPPTALPHVGTARRGTTSRTATAPIDPRDPAAVPRAEPTLADIDNLVAAAIAEAKLPGCVVTIGRRDRILFRKVYGLREVEPERVAMTEDTVFDLASLTKPVATATSIMILADRHKLDLDDPAAKYVPEFGKHNKAGITIRHLLTHVSGLPAETTLNDYGYGRAEAIKRISALEPRAAPGVKFIYSDIGFIILEEVVARVSKRDLAKFSAENIYRPLGMTETTYLPPAELRRRAAPTELRDGAWIVGEVHDPRAYRLGGISGNAGLFSTPRDMSRYAQAILGEGELDGQRILSKEIVRAMIAPHDVPGGIRALGWDMQTSFSVNRGDAMSRRAFGHGGFTGTVLWIDPESDLFVLFLSNRVHPSGSGATNALAGQIGTIAGRLFGGAARTESVARAGSVELGIDVLRADKFDKLQGAHVALVTNASGRASDGTRTVDLLGQAPGVKLVALFAPEHGISSNLDKKIDNGVDESTGLPVYSLYGNALAPTSATLEGVDTLVFDIQDAGARFFTYASTMHRTLKVAAEKQLRVLVLDRPNPLGGVDVAGPLPRTDELSFVNHHPLPVRHGLTFGELAELINADEHLGAKLEIVKMRGWKRGLYYDQTGLAWTPPSPNLRTVAEAVLYPGVALVEGTNVSVGRGTDTPFELVGAPWIDDRFVAALQSERLAGLTVVPTQFTPTSSTYAGTECTGARLEVTDRMAFEPVRLGIVIARALRELYPDDWHADKLDKIIGNKPITDAILDRQPLADIEALWGADLEAFRGKRKKYFLYPPEETVAAIAPR
jgi:uncharacterized protein YbbC (DUF1343 family)/CubicO group peptidase (beta-lactamase class C family)